MKQTSGRSVFQNMAMKCFYFVFCWQRKKKKNFTKKQFNTRLNLFIPSVTRDCRRLTMEQLHVKKEKEKVEWCLGVRWAGSESGCYISMFTGLAQCRTPLPSSTRTGHEEFGDQMIRESKSRKEKSVGRPTSCCGHAQTDRDFTELSGRRSENVSAFLFSVVVNSVTPAAWFSDGGAWKYWYTWQVWWQEISWFF